MCLNPALQCIKNRHAKSLNSCNTSVSYVYCLATERNSLIERRQPFQAGAGNLKAAFIVSTGRTGTDFFTTLYNEVVSNAWSLHEPKPAFRGRAREFLQRDPTPVEKLRFRASRQLRHLLRPEDCYIETNYHLFAAIPLIRESFPDAYVVHVVRDGRAVVTSWLNRWRYITNDHIRPEHVPGDPAVDHWGDWNPLQKLAWYWVTVNRRVEQTKPDLTVKFEDIFKGERKGVYRVLELLPCSQYDTEDVEKYLNRKVNRNPMEFFPPYAEWPERWKKQFWEIAGEEMRKWGYA
ncbi:hypothetical protein GF324_13295 [bacterium]|nr:hypothetical protein [bacterium]